jgi:uncharacterized protein YaiE (UPF0345 family)
MNTGLIAGVVKPLRGTLDANDCVYAIIRGPGLDSPSTGYTKLSLNVEAYDPNNLVFLASSVFTLVAGTYILVGQTTIWSSVTEGFVSTQARIRNTSDSVDVATSAATSVGVTSAGGLADIDSSDTHSHVLIGQVTIASSKNFELQAYYAGSPFTLQTSNSGNVNQVLIIKVS